VLRSSALLAIASIVACGQDAQPPQEDAGVASDVIEASVDAPADVFVPDAGVPEHAIDAGFFGMHLNKYGTPLRFGSERVWDAGVSWYALQTGPTTYDFTQLKYRTGQAQKYGFDVLYTFGHTPPSITKNGKNSADPPSDVAADGTGTDAYVKAFWTQFMATMCTGPSGSKTCDPIKYFEMWNEPNTDLFFTGTYAQLARMSADAATIIKQECPTCVVLSSDVSCGGDGYRTNGDAGQCDQYMAHYLDAWQKLGHMPDAGAWHAYPSHTNVTPSPMPETNVSTWDTCPQNQDSASCTCKAAFVPNPECRHSIVDQISLMRGVFDAHGLAGKPMYATEGGFNKTSNLPDVQEEIAYLARWYLLQAGAGVARVYYYAQDDWAPLVNPDLTLNAVGVAYNALYDWLVGGSIGPCTSTGTTWSCPVTTSNHEPALAMWDASASSTKPTPVDPSFTTWRDLAGASHAITGHEAPVGGQPILLQ